MISGDVAYIGEEDKEYHEEGYAEEGVYEEDVYELEVGEKIAEDDEDFENSSGYVLKDMAALLKRFDANMYED